MTTSRLWFVSDLHGSTRCFSKVLSVFRSELRPDTVVVGGDIVGKHVVPIVEAGLGFRATLDGIETRVSATELNDFSELLAVTGAYGWPCSVAEYESFLADPEFAEEISQRLIASRLRTWLDQADHLLEGTERKIFVNTANDDPYFVDQLIDASRSVVRPEGKLVELPHGVCIVSCGYSNVTPFDTYRELPEDALLTYIRSACGAAPEPGRAIFNFHCPPYNSTLDRAILLDADRRPRMSPLGPVTGPVGSTAVREAIEHYQPMVGLHGHIHESRGRARVGRTVCLNPGSRYSQGRLDGVMLVLEEGKMSTAALTLDEAGPVTESLGALMRRLSGRRR